MPCNRIQVVAEIIRADDKSFANQRGYVDLKNFWQFSGGKIESGEAL